MDTIGSSRSLCNAGLYYKDFGQKAQISPKSPCEVMLQTDVQISDDKIVHSLCPGLYTICQQQPSCGSLIELDLLLDNNSKRVFSENFLSVSLVSWTSRASIIVDQLTKSTYIIYTIVMENSEENHSCDKNAGFATRALHTKLKP